jgi:DNA gyrase subunit B
MRELAFLNKGITITLTDKRNVDDNGKMHSVSFHSEGGLREFASFLDRNREALIADVIYFEGEREGIPVEVALTYNTS